MFAKAVASILTVAFLVLAVVDRSRAAALFVFEEVGTDVVGILSGTLDFSGALNNPTQGSSSFVGIDPSLGQIFTTTDDLVDFGLISNDGAFGFGGSFSGIGSGDGFGLTAGNIHVPLSFGGSVGTGFGSGPISATLTLPGVNMSALQVDFGGADHADFVSTADGGDSVTVRFLAPQGVVPVPAGGGLLLSAVFFGWVLSRARSGHRPVPMSN